ncbi:hypothetical protein ES703_08213 [subsurface metagenome]
MARKPESIAEDRALVEQKRAELREMLVVGNVIPCRINGIHARRQILKVNYKRKSRKLGSLHDIFPQKISSIMVIYAFAPDGEPIRHKMDFTEIIHNVFINSKETFNYYFNRYYFYPRYISEPYPYGDLFEDSGKEFRLRKRW